ncbi:hypothetical protein HOP50_04g31130 [Chloropicon primus]|uniref:Uncharacterized protein n=1 Tax=Chloropicon primus TaxID=1764295 RepID=A0A5B8MJE8_9CHLO|nr:hypothetical protein A3770_04p31110 [Chloropicon primus]UPQ99804.1 hypothetical protein HOP50_04g31130 [Chloropicon primus]|eukprot:QDZ20593.1 hypothetical protein A3770_04p31110 [Chloropicon primus]
MSDNPWDRLGRGSSAGRALFALYSGDLAGRQAGNKYSQRNRDKFIKQLQQVNRAFEEEKIEKPKAIPKSQAKVTVPKFKKKKSSSSNNSYSIPAGKKPAHLIKDELKVLEDDLRNEATLMQPKRTLIGEREKQRYATHLEWNGNPPQELPADWQPRKSKGRRTEKEELRDLFDATMSEIDERRNFMEEMKAAGKGPAVLQQIKGEIQTRIHDLRRIDELMQEAAD